MNVTTALAITDGTKYAETTSARRWIGARLRWASATIWTMRERSVSSPTFWASMTRPPVPLIVAPMTSSPGPFSAGSGSPVTIDSSTLLFPSRTTPSTGIFSPGRTRSLSPLFTSSRDTSSSLPSSRMRRALFAAMPRSWVRALLVWLRARSSRTWPSRTSVTITAAASK